MIDKNLYKNQHDFLAELLMEPGVNQTDCNRGQMFTSHLNQCIQIEQSECPLVFTNFENQVGEYSTGYKKMDEHKYKVIKKIIKNKFNYCLIIQNLDTNEYDVIFRKESEWFTEHYGSRINNNIIDSFNENDIIKNDTIIYSDLNYDEDHNLKIGTNLNAVYLAYKGYTNEDAMVISESTAKKLSSYFVKKLIIHINTNDLLLNHFGNNKYYKSLPEVGEDISEGIFLVRRRINYEKILNDLNNSMKIKSNDTKYFAKGILTDIDIFCNSDLSEMKNQIYNKQILDIIENNNKFYKEFVDVVEPIIINKKKQKYSKDLLYYYNRFKMLIDPNKKFSYQGNIFDNYIIMADILEKRPVNIGCKISGRYGNKSVVSLILPDEQMPEYETFDGGEIREDTKIKMRADVILSPQGVFNRLNPSQLIEMEVNYISKHIRYRMEGLLKEDKVGKAQNLLLDYINCINKNECEKMKLFIKKLSNSQLKEFLNELVNDGIPIHQPPFFNELNIDKLEELYDKFNIPKSKCKNIENPLIIGEEYFLRLKHEPQDKFSSRSTSLNNLKDLPTKSRKHKEGKEKFSKTPIRIGEMEISNLDLCNNMADIKTLLDTYANNKQAREQLIVECLTGNPFDIEVPEINEATKSNNAKIIDALLYSIGLKINN